MPPAGLSAKSCGIEDFQWHLALTASLWSCDAARHKSGTSRTVSAKAQSSWRQRRACQWRSVLTVRPSLLDIRAVNSVSGTPLRVSPPEGLRHEERVRDVVFSPDGEVMLSGSNDNTRLWGMFASGTQIGFPIQHQGPVVAVAFAPDGKNFLTTSSDGTVHVWDTYLHQPVVPSSGRTGRSKRLRSLPTASHWLPAA